MRSLGVVVLVAAFGWAAQPPPMRPMQGNLKVGGDAPGFTLADVEGKNPVALAKLRGKPVVLVFGSCT